MATNSIGDSDWEGPSMKWPWYSPEADIDLANDRVQQDWPKPPDYAGDREKIRRALMRWNKNVNCLATSRSTGSEGNTPIFKKIADCVAIVLSYQLVCELVWSKLRENARICDVSVWRPKLQSLSTHQSLPLGRYPHLNDDVDSSWFSDSNQCGWTGFGRLCVWIGGGWDACI